MSIKVNFDKLEEMSLSAQSIARNVGGISSEIRALQYSLQGVDALRSINQLSIRVNDVNHKLLKLSESLSKTCSIYTAAEQRINQSFQNKGAKNLNTEGKTTDEAIFFENLKVGFKGIKDGLGEFGGVGKATVFLTGSIAQWAMTGKFSFTDTGASSLAEYVKDGNKVLEGLYDWTHSGIDTVINGTTKLTKNGFKELVGLGDVFSGHASQASTYGKRVLSNLKHQWKEGLDDLKIGGKAAFKVAGTALTVAVHAFENQEEMKTEGISQQRAVAETITESTIDILKDAAIGTAVAVGVGAIVVGGAPVVVPTVAVGVVTVGVGVGLDWATNCMMQTNKGFTETVSDGFLNFVGL